MPDTPSITINKRFTYRGVNEVWSNKYHFSGTTPTTDAAWTALALAIFNAEAPFLSTVVKYVGYLGHEAGNEFAVANHDWVAEGATLIGGGVTDDGDPYPGDVAQRIRWATPDRTSRGKRIYLSKYFHGIVGIGDSVNSTQKGLMQTYANKMIDGTLPGGVKYCGPQGAVASSPVVMPFVSYRQLKRTGKRPSR